MRSASVVAVVLLAVPAFAYDAPPLQSYSKPVADGKFVLVMLRPGKNDFKPDLRAKYGKSGLYPADDPTKPLWTCDWCADYHQNVVVTADGEWAVRVADTETGLRHWLLGIEGRAVPKPGDVWQDRPAVMIYRKGQLVHTLAVKDVFDPGRFTDRDLFMGPVMQIDAFEADTGRVWVSTPLADGTRQSAIVDTRNGAVSDKHNGGWFDDGTPKCGNNGPSDGWDRWVWVGLIGTGVVGIGAAAVIGLTVLLVRMQKR